MNDVRKNWNGKLWGKNVILKKSRPICAKIWNSGKNMAGFEVFKRLKAPWNLTYILTGPIQNSWEKKNQNRCENILFTKFKFEDYSQPTFNAYKHHRGPVTPRGMEINPPACLKKRQPRKINVPRVIQRSPRSRGHWNM